MAIVESYLRRRRMAVHHFRGHPQPPADENLKHAKNFLADEDKYRCLDFETRISEIQEYLAHLKKENIAYDGTLWDNVNIMVDVHQDWAEREAVGPRDTSPTTEPLIQPYSDRLVSSATAEELKAVLDSKKRARVRRMNDNLIAMSMNWHSEFPLLSAVGQASAASVGTLEDVAVMEQAELQRATIEIALNTMATNQEQHRLHDRFRIVDLPLPFKEPLPEFLLATPLDPANRPLEQDPFDYNKKLIAYRAWKDYDYDEAREISRKTYTEIIKTPFNYQGPFTVPQTNDLKPALQQVLAKLTAIADDLSQAHEYAPRPLLNAVLSAINQAMSFGKDPVGLKGHRLWDDVLLTKDDVELLLLLSEPSWDETKERYRENIPGITDVPGEWERFQDFENDTEHLKIPLWDPEFASSPDRFAQIVYDDKMKSRNSVSLGTLIQSIPRSDGPVSDPQNQDSAVQQTKDSYKYVLEMARARRIHMEKHKNDDKTVVRLSRIPFTGHPENRFITSRENPLAFPGVKRNEQGGLVVRYDREGTMGPPIFQPNKNTHYEKLAFRLGRDMITVIHQLAQTHEANPKAVFESQMAKIDNACENMYLVEHPGSTGPNNVTLQKLACDLLQVAPDLAFHAGLDLRDHDMTDQEAAALLQMQVIEECNNNWEYRFPENEHVWDFASRRAAPSETVVGNGAKAQLPVTQFFNMRRHPLKAQSPATQKAIEQSGPKTPVKTQLREDKKGEESMTYAQARAEANRAGRLLKMDRHIKGQRPHLPFGETPYQKAYQSWRIQQDLKDVPEFKSKLSPPGSTPVCALTPSSTSVFAQIPSTTSFFAEKGQASAFPLPEVLSALPALPADWPAKGVPVAEARDEVEADLNEMGIQNVGRNDVREGKRRKMGKI